MLNRWIILSEEPISGDSINEDSMYRCVLDGALTDHWSECCNSGFAGWTKEYKNVDINITQRDHNMAIDCDNIHAVWDRDWRYASEPGIIHGRCYSKDPKHLDEYACYPNIKNGPESQPNWKFCHVKGHKDCIKGGYTSDCIWLKRHIKRDPIGYYQWVPLPQLPFNYKENYCGVYPHHQDTTRPCSSTTTKFCQKYSLCAGVFTKNGNYTKPTCIQYEPKTQKWDKPDPPTNHNTDVTCTNMSFAACVYKDIQYPVDHWRSLSNQSQQHQQQQERAPE